MNYKLSEIALINPKESLPSGSLAKKVAMEKLQPFCRDIDGFELTKYNGGTKFRNGDTIMARITPCLENGKIAKVNILDEKEIGFGSTEYIIFRAKPGVTDEDFLYYLITSPIVRNPAIKSMVGSSGRQRVQTDVIQNLEIDVPELPIQKKIGSILKRIDDKIELNRKINDNLLKQAIEIYSDLIKDKDKNGCIGDYCTIKSGFAFKSNWWTDNGVKVVKIGSINQDNLDLNSCSYVSSENAVRAKEFIVKGGDLLIAMTGATIGKFAMVPSLNEGIYVNQRVGKFFLGDNPISRLPYIYCTLKQPDIYSEIINRGQGSAQPNISGGDIMSIPCVILSKEDIDDFNQKCKPIFSLMIDRQKENADLSDLRDSLLPKLMSGEIDVDSIEL